MVGNLRDDPGPSRRRRQVAHADAMTRSIPRLHAPPRSRRLLGLPCRTLIPTPGGFRVRRTRSLRPMPVPLAALAAAVLLALAASRGQSAPQKFDFYSRGPYHAGVPKPAEILGYEPG